MNTKINARKIEDMLNFPDFECIANSKILAAESKIQWIDTVMQIFKFENIEQILRSCWIHKDDKKIVLKTYAMARDKNSTDYSVCLLFNNHFLVYRIFPDKKVKLYLIKTEEDLKLFGDNLKYVL